MHKTCLHCNLFYPPASDREICQFCESPLIDMVSIHYNAQEVLALKNFLLHQYIPHEDGLHEAVRKFLNELEK